MRLSYWILFIALLLSTIAAYYSIQGLVTMFAGAAIPVIVMSSVMETAKVSITVWLHRYWSDVKLPMKCYLVPAVVILMLITSTGIFGLLARAHADQGATNGDISSRVAILDEKIKTERENIDSARAALAQMNASVDQTLARSTSESGAGRAVQVRKSQAKERQSLQNEITKSQERITKLNEERAPIASQLRRAEAEVGPIRYVAAMIYGDNPDITMLERAVRWVIVLLVVVFDPLAIFMVLAANESLKWEQAKRKLSVDETESTELERFMRTERKNLNDVTDRVVAVEDRMDHIIDTLEHDIEILTQRYARELQPRCAEPDEDDDVPVLILTPYEDDVTEPERVVEIVLEETTTSAQMEIPFDVAEEGVVVEEIQTVGYRSQGFPFVVVDEPTIEPTIEQPQPDPEILEAINAVVLSRKPDHVWKTLNPGKTLKEQRRMLEHGLITELPWENHEFVRRVNDGEFDSLFKDVD